MIEVLDLALSIRQPYVEMILTREKRIEYRSRRTHVRGRVYLYAGKTYELGNEGWPEARVEVLPMGMIVGSVEIVDCIPWATGKGFDWCLIKPIRYCEPWAPIGVPMPVFWKPKGRQ